MRHILILVALFIVNSVSAQKVYLTREGVQRLTKRLNECSAMQKELVRTKIELNRLGDSILKIDSITKIVQMESESKIQNIQNEYKILEAKYDKVIRMLPKKKRKQIK